MKIIFGSDENTKLTEFINKYLKTTGHQVKEVGHLVTEKQKWHWAEIGKKIGKEVSESNFDMGIVCCWSGTGVCMAANRFKKARAALVWDKETAELARKWDDANILCLSLRFTTTKEAKKILDSWFTAKFDEEDLDQVKHLV